MELALLELIPTIRPVVRGSCRTITSPSSYVSLSFIIAHDGAEGGSYLPPNKLREEVGLFYMWGGLKRGSSAVLRVDALRATAYTESSTSPNGLQSKALHL